MSETIISAFSTAYDNYEAAANTALSEAKKLLNNPEFIEAFKAKIKVAADKGLANEGLVDEFLYCLTTDHILITDGDVNYECLICWDDEDKEWIFIDTNGDDITLLDCCCEEILTATNMLIDFMED